MTVRELIELLQEQPDLDAPVLLRADNFDTRGWVPYEVESVYDWREPEEYITFIDY